MIIAMFEQAALTPWRSGRIAKWNVLGWCNKMQNYFEYYILHQPNKFNIYNIIF